MNTPILKLFGLVLALFAALAAMTCYNAVIKADDYRDNALNKRPQIEQAQVKRGVIRARDGSLLARSQQGEDGLYSRRYPAGAQRFSHVLGYDYGLTIGRAGLERSRNDALAGEKDEITSIVDDLRGERKVGDDVVTNLDPRAQQVALDALGDRRGSVVALEPATGKVHVMASTPGYDPGDLRRSGVYSRLSRQDDSPLFNRATQVGYAPGSTMKVVTAAAALDSGEFTPQSQVSGTSPIIVSGVPLKNFSDKQFGSITLTTALTNSVNTVWAQVAEKLGRERVAEYMERFGFGADLPLDYPDEQMNPSGVFDAKRQRVISADSGSVDIGRIAIGQERLRVTPLQMATVVATVANGGVLMQPQIDEPDRRPRRPHGRADRVRPGAPRDVGQERRAAHADDGQRRARGHRHGGRAGGHRGRRQDRHRRAEHRPLDQPALVRRLRAALAAEGRDRRDAGERRRRPGRRRRRADRQAGHAGAAAMRGGIEQDTVIDERYQVIAHLGSGGMADVYCADDLQLGRKVALKILHERFAADEEFVERFKREASSAAGLQHQHVVAVYDRGEWDGTSYIAMEYVAGQTLKQIVTDNGGPLEPARAVDLTGQILRAARFAHRRGVIHRDFKPHNVIVDDEGRAKVTDFGIARAGASDMTQTGSIMGTAQYLSPEQAQGHAVNARSDLYSIGIILYELLTGKVPFEADSAVTIALKQVSEAPVAPRLLNSAVTPELESVVLRALMKDPQERFADADEFIAALEAAASRIPSAAAIAAAEAAAAALPAAAPGGLAAGPAPTGPVAPLTGVYPAQLAPQREREVVAPPPPRRAQGRKRWPWLLLGALALVGLILLLVSVLTPERVQVPNVVGSSISVATQRLQNEGFEVVPVRDNSDKPRNTVIGQDPQGGTSAQEGSRVTINVSDGPSLVDVPAVVGDGRNEARRKLVAAGFKVEEVRVASDSVKINRVVSQTPDPVLYERGKVVTIEVSSGPEQLPVPDVVGKTEDEARSALDAFRVVVQEKEDVEADPGTVLAQKPARGALRRGGTVTLSVAIEPKLIAVPDVVGRSQNLATKLLSGRGFEVAVEEVAVDSPTEDGRVREQSPAAGGDKVERGTTVTITVGRFDDSALNPEPGTETTTTPTTTTTTPAP